MDSATIDPVYFQHGKKDNRTPLKKALDGTASGIGVNACPFGCGPANVDNFGWCDHLVGFCNASLDEPRTFLRDGEVKEVPEGIKVEVFEKDRDELGRLKVGPLREPLRKGDHLVRITHSARVYRRSGRNSETQPAAPAAKTK